MPYFLIPELDRLLTARSSFIFDLNGLLIDDEPLQLAATNAAFGALGLTIDDETWRTRCVGRKPFDYLPAMLAQAGAPADEAAIRTRLEQKDTVYGELIAVAGADLVRPGVLRLMEYGRAARCAVVVCTSTTRRGVEIVLRNAELGLGSLVDDVVCGDEVRIGKPAPDIYLESLKRARSTAAGGIAFEDTATGLQSARAAGIDCIVCPNAFTRGQDFAGAAMVVSDLAPGATPV